MNINFKLSKKILKKPKKKKFTAVYKKHTNFQVKISRKNPVLLYTELYFVWDWKVTRYKKKLR